MRIPFCCSPRKNVVLQPPGVESAKSLVDSPSKHHREGHTGQVVDILRRKLCAESFDPRLPDTAVHDVIDLLVEAPIREEHLAAPIEATAKACIAELTVYERRMMSSWIVKHRGELAGALRAHLVAEADNDNKVQRLYAVSASLKAIGPALEEACEVVSAVSPGPLDENAYKQTLSSLLKEIANADRENASLGERNRKLAEMLEATAACGGASRALSAETRDQHHAIIRAALTDLEPLEFEAVVRALCGSAEPSTSTARRQASPVLRNIRKHYDYAACELAKIRAIALSLRGDDLASSEYARIRGRKSLPFLDVLLAAARTLGKDGDASGLMKTWRGMMSQTVVSNYMKAPLFSDQCVRAFGQLHKALYALMAHCDRTFRRVVPEGAGQLSRAMVRHFTEMISAVSSGAPEAPDAMVQSITRMGKVLSQIHASLEQAADAALARAIGTLGALVAMDDLSVRRWQQPRDTTEEFGPRVETLLLDLRLVSDVAKATGFERADLATLRRGLARLIIQSADRLTDSQRKALRYCDGIGMPLSAMCELTETVSAVLPSILRPKSANGLAIGMKQLTNSMIALSHHAAALDPNAAPDTEGLVAFAAGASLHVLTESFTALGPRHASSLASILSQPAFRTSSAIVESAAARLTACDEKEGVANWAAAPVTAGFEAALLVWCRSLAKFIDHVLQKMGLADKPTGDRSRNKQQARAFEAIAAAWGIKLAVSGKDTVPRGVENAEFYVTSGRRPRRAVLSDFRLSGDLFDVCRRKTVDPKSFTPGEVRVVFPNHCLPSGKPDEFVVSPAMWCDINRSHFAIDDIIVDRHSFDDSEQLATAVDPAGPPEREYVESQNASLYRFLTALRKACSAEPAQSDKQLRTVSALMNQTMAGGMHAVTAGRALGYGWLGKGLFVKPMGHTTHNLRCARLENSHGVRLELELFERISILARGQENGPQLGDLHLDSDLSVCACHVAVDVERGAIRMPLGGTTMKYALVEDSGRF
jgi:hypothetical protein